MSDFGTNLRLEAWAPNMEPVALLELLRVRRGYMWVNKDARVKGPC